ncbi:MAG: sensor histidine kinase [Ruminococcus sp.]|nr:sensor histidine kinase [Ruminococcus sp.]
MDDIFQRLAAALLCAVAFSFSGDFSGSVAGMLVLLTVSSLSALLTDKRISSVLIMLYSAAVVFFPVLVCGAPLIVYEAVSMKKKWTALPMLLVVPDMAEIVPMQMIISAAGAFTAYVMRGRVAALEEQVAQLRSMRDETAEINMQLDDRNRRLTEAQDNEVRLATLRERNRIAREIHDNVGHMLTRSLLQSAALIVINKDEQLKEPLESLRSTLDSAMTSIRQSVHDLHDDSVDLRKVIDDSASSVGERFSVTVEYDISDDVPAKVKLCIAGIVKESISNAVKHSTGDRIFISVREHPAFYQLQVEDNGACKELADTGIGLKNMRDRAESLRGVISFTPSETGFRVFASLPKN